MCSNSFKIRLWIIRNLIFFISLILISCSQEKESEILIVWENDKAIGLKFPNSLTTDNLEIRLIQEGERGPILGKFEVVDNQRIFKPLIPFTRGLSYEVMSKGKEIAQIHVPLPKGEEAIPKLTSIFPSKDTVPENLLKIYLNFSQPMKEGVALNYLALLNSDNDTVQGVFLDLQPELWNESKTQLTVWLDPGRIKRDLIPNLEMGAPLESFKDYQLVVSKGWKGQNGTAIASISTKSLTVNDRDSISPNPDNWIIKTPTINSKEGLQIDFLESLDYSLLHEVFKLKNEDGQEIPGTWKVGPGEKSITFLPTDNWEAGNYTIQIESRLEDLAGNNLNRLFETDLENKNEKTSEKSSWTLNYSIQN
jgi:hypothetical protein